MKFKLLASSLLMAGAFALSGAVSVANAAAVLSIVGAGSSVGNLIAPSHAETNGDAGGTSYPWPNNTAGGGAGLPTIAGGWPDSTNFGTESSFGRGIAGYDESYLWLSESANVTFQFMGGGDSGLINEFWVNGQSVSQASHFLDSHNGNPTNPIAVSGNPPVYGPPSVGGYPTQNQYTLWIDVAAGGGYVPFQYKAGGTDLTQIINDGINNPNDASGHPGYFLGIDPYTYTGGGNPTSGRAVFAGLADLPRDGDHDYQDMGVRISVAPEPGSFVLLSAGLLAFVALRRRRPMATAEGLLA